MKYQLIQYLIALKTGIIEGNPELKVNETTIEGLDMVEDQITEEHLYLMILNLINTDVGSYHRSESEWNNLVKIISLHDAELSI